EEHVPAHLAADRGAGLLHFRLDQRMPGFPHDRRAAVLRDVVEEALRALDLADHDRPGTAREDLPREDDEDLVPPEDPSPGRDDAEPVAVAVEREPDVRTVLGDGAD